MTINRLFKGLGLALLLASAALSLSAKDVPRPNVLVILTDDQRWDALSSAGHPFFKSPHLDRIAHEGARFANAFVTTSLCSPSRASLLSGLYPHRHKVLNNFTDYPVSLPSYPQRLKKVGYETAYIGKWHMGEQTDDARPGFDHWISHKGQGKYFDTEFNMNGTRKVVPGYYTSVVTDMALDYLKKPRQKPFLLILGQKAPHGGPIEPEPRFQNTFDEVPIRKPANAEAYRPPEKPEWLEKSYPTWHGLGGPLYNIKDYAKFVRSYYGTLMSVDESVGKIYAALEASGQLNNTLLIFTSDNGFALGEHGRVDKRTMYEESIRVPFLVRYPPLVKAGSVVQEMILNVDLAPSILDICDAPGLPGIDGRSWKKLLAGKTRGWRKTWLYEYNYEREFPYTPNVRGVRSKEWKYITYPSGPDGRLVHKSELYNVKKDPLELDNLADDPVHAGRLKQMKGELRQQLRQTRALPDRPPRDEGIINVLPKF